MLAAFKNRNPWAAALISFLFTPIIGMCYLNRGRAAVAYLFAILALVSLQFYFLPTVSSPSQLQTIGQLIGLAITLIGLVHAIILARAWDGDEILNWYARRWYVLAFVFVGFYAFLFGIRAFLYRPFDVPSTSMEPSISRRDFFLVYRAAYNSSLPERGDPIVFYAPQFRNYFIKRIAGIPDDRVQMKSGILYINDKPVPKIRVGDYVEALDGEEHHVAQFRETLPDGKSYLTLDRDPDGPGDNTDVYIVPAGHYFMMGDNRDNSADSRTTIGYVARSDIIGRAAYKYISHRQWVWEPIN